ncbi:uncharacterized protein FRV6_16615 [Fusarium oxysporum]|uniref:Uncharacterized protein n=1 Tax=Fusarium oxysporum TaxID=5507 RepID=A0A2H3TV60_FUSOX|nr:uncharacterized protein FRV6_16615 [Fusarium oxysporum]
MSWLVLLNVHSYPERMCSVARTFGTQHGAMGWLLLRIHEARVSGLLSSYDHGFQSGAARRGIQACLVRELGNTRNRLANEIFVIPSSPIPLDSLRILKL